MMFRSQVVPTVGDVHSTLAGAGLGEWRRVVRVHEPGSMGERLMEMGLTPGTAVKVVRRSLLGRLMVVEVRGYQLSLRRENAAHIEVNDGAEL